MSSDQYSNPFSYAIRIAWIHYRYARRGPAEEPNGVWFSLRFALSYFVRAWGIWKRANAHG